ncbi:MAG TPA: PQQ-binding-like beta-propeller repeat protein [Pirellulales bacterium]|jgi:outer membrane protein assembly factor BamB|nr:PQQ-binding-like beta-propeller repeat protein [Pirellulales bacterium]
MRTRFSLLLAIAAISCMPLRAARAGDDWVQFRGQGGQGVSDSTGLPLTWSESENIAWKTPIPGKGWSSPVVLGNQIWLTTALDDGHSLRAVCVDRQSGRIVYDTEVFQIEEPVHVNAKNSHASPTSAIEPGRLYVHFGTMGTACLSTETGKTLWTNQELKLDHAQGPGSSLILYGDLLIVTCDGMDVQYVIALDKHTGLPVWKTNRSGKPHDSVDRRKAFATPAILPIKSQSENRRVEHPPRQGLSPFVERAPSSDGREQRGPVPLASGGSRIGSNDRDELISPAANQVIAYNPATGDELWKVRYDGYSNVPVPVYGDGLLFIGTGFDKAQLWAIRPGEHGDATGTNVAWKFTKEAPLDPTPVFVGHELYVVSDSGVATCLESKTGAALWRHRLGGSFSASPLSADGRIYFFAESGDTTVIEPGRKYKELAAHHLDGRIMATPAIAGRAIILRTDTHLYRIEGK